MAMIRHSSKMDRPKETITDSTWAPSSVQTNVFILLGFTVEHAGLCVGETQTTGVQQVGWFDGRFGN